ncbi:hypothetical protein K461DRAFT_281196 [Myriangium duriaei CBS 260.36]|uniref:Nudix hydrolase domain-containing protein n=1 Tax=Myriangium duriaei CBS 260.36 TaxID=1168546 RepID=A0A9P4MJM3_9PEZI|nr:hypothetical protein K461DRAFT_281196 [Myriangium duriaei CBS 260.36]
MPRSSAPVVANFASSEVVFAAGSAIFHLATGRVVLCRAGDDGGWFLPKGRRDAGEELGITAIREGFEESGYRCRLLPLPVAHRQPRAADDDQVFYAEPLWTQLVPVRRGIQYMCCWYAAETLTEEGERATNVVALGEAGTERQLKESKRFAAPTVWEKGLTVGERKTQDQRAGGTYEPLRHEGTGVDEEEATYQSFLVDVEEARRRLKGSIQEDVVRRAWEAVLLREKLEQEAGWEDDEGGGG